MSRCACQTTALRLDHDPVSCDSTEKSPTEYNTWFVRAAALRSASACRMRSSESVPAEIDTDLTSARIDALASDLAFLTAERTAPVTDRTVGSPANASNSSTRGQRA